MVTDDEWSERFSSEVKGIVQAMLMFNQDIADGILSLLDDPIKNEKAIRGVLNSFRVSIHMSSPRGENRDQDVVGIGRSIVWSCGDDDCRQDHCTICGRCKSNAGDGHVPWYDNNRPPCESKPRFRKDRQEEG